MKLALSIALLFLAGLAPGTAVLGLARIAVYRMNVRLALNSIQRLYTGVFEEQPPALVRKYRFPLETLLVWSCSSVFTKTVELQLLALETLLAAFRKRFTYWRDYCPFYAEWQIRNYPLHALAAGALVSGCLESLVQNVAVIQARYRKPAAVFSLPVRVRIGSYWLWQIRAYLDAIASAYTGLNVRYLGISVKNWLLFAAGPVFHGLGQFVEDRGQKVARELESREGYVLNRYPGRDSAQAIDRTAVLGAAVDYSISFFLLLVERSSNFPIFTVLPFTDSLVFSASRMVEEYRLSKILE